MLLIKYEGVLFASAIVLGLIAFITKGTKYEVPKARWITHLASKTILGIELVVLTICSTYTYGASFPVGLLTTAIVGVYFIFVGIKEMDGLEEYAQLRADYLAKKELKDFYQKEKESLRNNDTGSIPQ